MRSASQPPEDVTRRAPGASFAFKVDFRLFIDFFYDRAQAPGAKIDRADDLTYVSS